MDTFTCPVCGTPHPVGQRAPTGTVLPSTAATIAEGHPNWSPDDPVCRDCLNEGRAAEAEAILEAEMGELTDSEREVVDTIRNERLISVDTDDEFEQDKGGAERLAHRVAGIIGSWWFASGVLLAIIAWLIFSFTVQPFEPHPVIVFALISAVLASLAALEGPVILMSQRRQRMRDRSRSKVDYAVNLKAELEIRLLEEKLDMVLARQQEIAYDVADLRGRSAQTS